MNNDGLDDLIATEDYLNDDGGESEEVQKILDNIESAVSNGIAKAKQQAKLDYKDALREEIGAILYNSECEGCGLEDRGIIDRYEAMQYGWESAMDEVLETLESMENTLI